VKLHRDLSQEEKRALVAGVFESIPAELKDKLAKLWKHKAGATVNRHVTLELKQSFASRPALVVGTGQTRSKSYPLKSDGTFSNDKIAAFVKEVTDLAAQKKDQRADCRERRVKNGAEALELLQHAIGIQGLPLTVKLWEHDEWHIRDNDARAELSIFPQDAKEMEWGRSIADLKYDGEMFTVKFRQTRFSLLAAVKLIEAAL
jgi:hypothetical protein